MNNTKRMRQQLIRMFNNAEQRGETIEDAAGFFVEMIIDMQIAVEDFLGKPTDDEKRREEAEDELWDAMPL